MARLYANENFPLPVVVELRRLGHDVLTSREAGNADRSVPDEEVLAFAIAEERIIITLNRLHFIRLHRLTPAHPGIIVCTFDLDFVALAGRIDRQLRSIEDPSGHLLRVNRPQRSRYQ